jgi:hypothetical protein
VIHTPAKAVTVADLRQCHLSEREKSHDFKEFHQKIPGYQFQSNLKRIIKNNAQTSLKKGHEFQKAMRPRAFKLSTSQGRAILQCSFENRSITCKSV